MMGNGSSGQCAFEAQLVEQACSYRLGTAVVQVRRSCNRAQRKRQAAAATVRWFEHQREWRESGGESSRSRCNKTGERGGKKGRTRLEQ